MRRIAIACLLVPSALAAAGCANLQNPIAQLRAERQQHNKTQVHVARLHERNGHLGKASEIYLQILADDPENSQVCHRLAVVATQQGDYDEAVEYFEKAVRLAPHDPDILADLGYALHLRHESESAEQVLRKALWEDSNHERAINNLALVLGDQQRYDEAFQTFRQTLDEAESHANLAYIYAQQGHGQKAIEHYTRALEIDANLKAAKNGLLQIAELKHRIDATGGSLPKTAIAAKQAARPEIVQTGLQNAGGVGTGSPSNQSTGVQTAVFETDEAVHFPRDARIHRAVGEEMGTHEPQRFQPDESSAEIAAPDWTENGPPAPTSDSRQPVTNERTQIGRLGSGGTAKSPNAPQLEHATGLIGPVGSSGSDSSWAQ